MSSPRRRAASFRSPTTLKTYGGSRLMRGKSMPEATRVLLRPARRTKTTVAGVERKIVDHRRRVKLRRLLAGERVCDETTIVAMEPAVPDAEAFARALAAERRRSIRFVAWLRFLGISIAFALNEVLPSLLPGARPFQSDSRLFASYWLAAAAVFWATRHSARAARLVGLDVAVVDIPFAFLLQWTVVLRNPAISAVPLTGTIFFMLLVLVAAFSLEAWRIVLAAAVGAAAEVWLLSLSPEAVQFIVWAVPVIAGVALICVYNTRRTLRLVEGVAREQRR